MCIPTGPRIQICDLRYEWIPTAQWQTSTTSSGPSTEKKEIGPEFVAVIPDPSE